MAGESLADIGGTLEAVSSFMTGLGESLAQGTTWDAALIGGLGSTISGNLNFVNTISYFTPKGRQAFKEQYGTEYERDAEGYIQYDTKPILDESGNPIKG